jgi:hypothetical protein
MTVAEIIDFASPPAIKRSVVRLVCTACGAEANASCNCGKPYVPAAQRVAEYDRANPGTSTRQAAADLGVSKSEVSRARQSPVPDGTPATVTGRDGRTYPAKRYHSVPVTDASRPAYSLRVRYTPPDLVAEAHKRFDKIEDLMHQMTKRQRAKFRKAALKRMTDAYLDDDTNWGDLP